MAGRHRRGARPDQSHQRVLDIFIAGARGLGLSDLDYREVVQLKNARAYPDQTASKVA